MGSKARIQKQPEQSNGLQATAYPAYQSKQGGPVQSIQPNYQPKDNFQSSNQSAQSNQQPQPISTQTDVSGVAQPQQTNQVTQVAQPYDIGQPVQPSQQPAMQNIAQPKQDSQYFGNRIQRQYYTPSQSFAFGKHSNPNRPENYRTRNELSSALRNRNFYR